MSLYWPAPLTRCAPTDPAASCAERRAAVRAGTILWDATRRGWIMTDVPLRRASARARYWALEGTHPATDGEPYTFATCPFCGGELPDLTPPAQADGADGFTFGGDDGPE